MLLCRRQQKERAYARAFYLIPHPLVIPHACPAQFSFFLKTGARVMRDLREVHHITPHFLAKKEDGPFEIISTLLLLSFPPPSGNLQVCITNLRLFWILNRVQNDGMLFFYAPESSHYNSEKSGDEADSRKKEGTKGYVFEKLNNHLRVSFKEIKHGSIENKNTDTKYNGADGKPWDKSYARVLFLDCNESYTNESCNDKI